MVQQQYSCFILKKNSIWLYNLGRGFKYLWNLCTYGPCHVAVHSAISFKQIACSYNIRRRKLFIFLLCFFFCKHREKNITTAIYTRKKKYNLRTVNRVFGFEEPRQRPKIPKRYCRNHVTLVLSTSINQMWSQLKTLWGFSAATASLRHRPSH